MSEKLTVGLDDFHWAQRRIAKLERALADCQRVASGATQLAEKLERQLSEERILSETLKAEVNRLYDELRFWKEDSVRTAKELAEERARLAALLKAAEEMIDNLDHATADDEWSTSELRVAVDAAR